MSVIVWDGEIFASDRQATRSGLKYPTTKIFEHDGNFVGITGDQDVGMLLLDWFKDEGEYPTEAQKDKDGGASMFVVMPGDVGEETTIWIYDRHPIPTPVLSKKFALGSGRDFALAAMECGKNAIEAVEIACKFESGCGLGYYALKHDALGNVVIKESEKV